MPTLVTGADGFAGRHLCELMRAGGETVAGLVRRPDEPDPPEGVELIGADVTDAAAVEGAVRAAAPDRLFHLAAVSIPADALEAPTETFAVNALGTLHVLEAVRRHAPRCRVVVVGSSEVYGRRPGTAASLREEDPLEPENPYAASKAAADLLALQYARGFGLHVVRARPFNHTGPGQSPRLVWSAFAEQVARAEAGLAEPLLRVGNLDVARDFSDVRDVVRAYALLAERGRPGEAYNVCSGRADRLRELVELLLGEARCWMQVQVDPRRVRAGEPPVVCGDPSRIAAATGWAASTPMRQTLRDLLDWWRARVRARSA
jgi:GDP-4-dehydro-6-deoxy-D-mannose reductase